MGITDKKPNHLPSIGQQVRDRWAHARMTNYHSLGLQDAGYFLKDCYAMPSFAVLEALFHGTDDGAFKKYTDKQVETSVSDKKVILSLANPNPTDCQVLTDAPWQLIMNAYKKNAEHWKPEYAAKNMEALSNVISHLMTANIDPKLAAYLGEDLVRQHFYNCRLPKSFRWATFKSMVEAVYQAAQTSLDKLTMSLNNCDMSVIYSLSAKWPVTENHLSFTELVEKDGEQCILYRKDGMAWIEDLRNVSMSVLNEIPQISSGSYTALDDKNYGSARRWLILNAQELLMRLSLKSGNGRTGPLARFVGQVDFATRNPSYDRLQKRKGEKMVVPPEWASKFVEEMRPRK